MKALVVALGAAVIVAYSLVGALLMTRWEVVAASGVSFEETVARMEAAGEPHSYLAAIIFAALGVLLTLGWTYVTVTSKTRSSGWYSFALWGAIIAFGAPAYFFTSFGNMNSVGDVFYDWDSEAAFALVTPLYILSGIGAVIAIAALIIGLARLRLSPISRSA